VLEHFVKAAVETTSTFQATKTGNGPSVVHVTGAAEFGSAKAAVDRDLGHLLGSDSLSGTDAVYSIHFSDLNGLSKLENNILAHEISVYLCTYPSAYATNAKTFQPRRIYLHISPNRPSTSSPQQEDGLSLSVQSLRVS
jgi:hypothetical protein